MHDFPSDSKSDSLSDYLLFGTGVVECCFPKFGASQKNYFVDGFVFAEDKGRLVSNGKSDRESDGHPICMQIRQRIGCKNVRVDGPLKTSLCRLNSLASEDVEAASAASGAKYVADC
jgi:hypothetical protein